MLQGWARYSRRSHHECESSIHSRSYQSWDTETSSQRTSRTDIYTTEGQTHAVYWPKMQDDITNMINRCQECQIHAKKKPRPPQRQVSASRPLQMLGVDLMDTHHDWLLLWVHHIWFNQRWINRSRRWSTEQQLPEARNGRRDILW